MIFSILPSSLPLWGTLLLSSSCPHESISGQRPHFVCGAVYLRTIRPAIQVLGSDKNSSSPNALGQCGCYSGGWVYGCRWVSKGLAVKRKELQKLTPQQPRWCWSHSTFPWHWIHYKKNKLKANYSGSTFPLQSNSLCVSRRGLEHLILVQLEQLPLKCDNYNLIICRQQQDLFHDFLLLVGTFCEETTYFPDPQALYFWSRCECLPVPIFPRGHKFWYFSFVLFC